MASEEPLQVAQILADLMSLQNTDHHAASSLLLANKTLKTPSTRSKSSSSTPVPSLKKMDSNLSSMSGLSESLPEEDEDMRRAKELVKLYAMRGKFKQIGDSGLGRAKQRVDDVVQRYVVQERRNREEAAKPRY